MNFAEYKVLGKKRVPKGLFLTRVMETSVWLWWRQQRTELLCGFTGKGGNPTSAWKQSCKRIMHSQLQGDSAYIFRCSVIFNYVGLIIKIKVGAWIIHDEWKWLTYKNDTSQAFQNLKKMSSNIQICVTYKRSIRQHILERKGIFFSEIFQCAWMSLTHLFPGPSNVKLL